MIPKGHYTLSYKDNIKCGTARVIVKIKDGDPVYEGEDFGYFTIRPKKAVIKSLKAGSGKLTIKVKNQKASGVHHYNVYYRIKGKARWSAKTFKASKGAKLVVKGLKKGRKYQVKVAAATKEDDEGADSKVKTSKKIG